MNVLYYLYILPRNKATHTWAGEQHGIVLTPARQLLKARCSSVLSTVFLRVLLQGMQRVAGCISTKWHCPIYSPIKWEDWMEEASLRVEWERVASSKGWRQGEVLIRLCCMTQPAASISNLGWVERIEKFLLIQVPPWKLEQVFESMNSTLATFAKDHFMWYYAIERSRRESRSLM